MDPSAKPVTLELGGQTFTLHFDLNAFSKYEELSGGRSFPDFLMSMADALNSAKGADGEPNPLLFLRHLSLRDLQHFVAAACIEYGADDEPHWRYTPGQLGRLITMDAIPGALSTIMRGQADNGPPTDAVRPTSAAESHSESPIGSNASGLSDADLLASLTVKSDG